MHKSYGGCGNDYGWFVNVDMANPACDWEKHWTNGGVWPRFLYVTAATYQNYLTYNNIDAADNIGIFTKPGTLSAANNYNICPKRKLMLENAFIMSGL